MGMLEELIKLNDGQPKTVTAGLIAVITVGTLGGGLYLNTLRSQNAWQEKNGIQQLEIARDRYASETANLNRRLEMLSQRLDISTAQLAGVDSALDRTETLLALLRQSESSSRNMAVIDSIILELRFTSRELRVGLDDSRLIRAAEARGFTPQ